jgi:hypothetical protein
MGGQWTPFYIVNKNKYLCYNEINKKNNLKEYNNGKEKMV